MELIRKQKEKFLQPYFRAKICVISLVTSAPNLTCFISSLNSCFSDKKGLIWINHLQRKVKTLFICPQSQAVPIRPGFSMMRYDAKTAGR